MIFLYLLWKKKTFQASVLHALMSSLFTGLMYIDFIFPKFQLARISLLNSLIYFIADMSVRFDWGKCLHHLISGLSCLIALSLSPEIQIYTAKACGIMETANPCWAALRLRLENSNEIYLPVWYTKIIAGGTFIVTFFLTRFIWFPWFVFTEIPDNFPWRLFWIMFTPLMTLNSYWMFLLIRGFYKEIIRHIKYHK